jgi:hypothetical protein
MARPYRDARGAVQFTGYGWGLLLAVPWVIGVATIISWL